MFDLSLAEMGVILVTAALVTKPKDLPIAMRKLGRSWAKFKRFGGDLRQQFDDSVIGQELRAAQAEVEREGRMMYDAQGLGHQSFSLDGIRDASRDYLGPTPHIPPDAPPSLLPAELDAPQMLPLVSAGTTTKVGHLPLPERDKPPPLEPLIIKPDAAHE